MSPAVASLFLAFLPAVPAAQTLAVALPEENRVLLFDARTYDRLASLPVGRAPHEIAASPDGRHLYVGNTVASGRPERLTVTRIDPAEPARTREIAAGHCTGLHDLRVSRSGRLLWTACARMPGVAELDLATGTLRRQ